MAAVGKFFVFLNTFACVALLAWSTSAYVNRIDWIDRKGGADGTELIKGEMTLMQDEIKKLATAAADADSAYGAKAAKVAAAETIRDTRRVKYDVRLRQAKQGTFRVQLRDVTDPAFVDLDRDGPAILDADNKPLRGYEALSADLDKEARDGQVLRNGKKPTADADWANLDGLIGTPAFAPFQTEMGTTDLRRLHGLLSDRIAATDLAKDKQKDILVNLKDEAKFLGDKRVNWVAELQTLERRQSQLQNRLKALGAAAAK